jgi:ribosomal protein S18 acetylase RimI-like enzyme
MTHALLNDLRFLIRWRAAMMLELAGLVEQPRLPEGYRIGAWQPGVEDAIAEVDFRAYHGTIDGALYWRYFCSRRGCRQMWEEAFQGRFGAFDGTRTRVLYHGERLCGDVLCCVRNRDEGFIANIAVMPEDRGGTGRALLLSALRAYHEAGFRRVSLAVTMANTHAYRLYESLGFRRLYRFPVVARPGAAQWPACGEEVTARG